MRSRWLYHSYLYCKRATTTKSNVARFTTHESNLSCHKSANKPSWPILLGQWRRYYQCDKNQIFSCGTKRDWSRANRVGLSCSQSEHKICFILPARGLNPYKSYYSSQEKYLKAGLICTFTAINQFWKTTKDFKKNHRGGGGGDTGVEKAEMALQEIWITPLF